MEVKVSNGRRYIIWEVKIVFLLTLLLGEGRRRPFCNTGLICFLVTRTFFSIY